MDEQMAAWMKYASPSSEHEFLKKLDGTWNAKVTMWMKPGEPPMESTGTARNEMVFEGRYLVSRFEGNTPFGPFQGMAVDAYDRINEKYTGVWIDSMGTLIMVFEGQVEGNVRTMVATFTSPMTGQPTTMKGVTTIDGPDAHRYESWVDGPDGKPYKNMEIAYGRR